MVNLNLVPDIIRDLVSRYLKARQQNEKFLMEDRLKAIVEYIQEALNQHTAFTPKKGK